ncbi:D-aminoacyl-tRNA deacylase [Cytophagales bacterium LB-30]|uniref:D-aminoacyl-tRNA deacylase n=1 Tax=Shiella aurantiaca TaxID=3058365 RepID=A0ABT8F811_9BACT|nr:D-aminoacyl-tRNA deacylase [Shiella aurantiaca]MDN4166520.1 D-aminoacyl-tRNA deacylase [Shiella aurantiaca]
MIAVIQRVSSASVEISGQRVATIGRGFLVLLGVGNEDGEEDVQWLAQKVANLRVFSDAQGQMNLGIQEVQGDIIVVSQFTLHASTKKGNRPSFIQAAKPPVAIPLYEAFVAKLEEFTQKKVQTGEFGADMQVALVNDGPVTIIIDSKNKQ